MSALSVTNKVRVLRKKNEEDTRTCSVFPNLHTALESVKAQIWNTEITWLGYIIIWSHFTLPTINHFPFSFVEFQPVISTMLETLIIFVGRPNLE